MSQKPLTPKYCLKYTIAEKFKHDAIYRDFLKPGNPYENDNYHFSYHVDDILTKAAELYHMQKSKSVKTKDFIRYCLDILFSRKLTDEEFEAAQENLYEGIGEIAAQRLRVSLAYNLNDISVYKTKTAGRGPARSGSGSRWAKKVCSRCRNGPERRRGF